MAEGMAAGVEDLRHRDGLAWHDAPVPPPDHVCWTQTSGWIGLNQYERCACGAVRRNGLEWWDRNTRNQPAREPSRG